MTEHTMLCRREGTRVAIDTLVEDKDYQGVVNTSYIDPLAAIRVGEALVRMGREILAEAPT